MKKRYQMDRENAVRGFRKQAEESEQELQLHLPLKEVAAALQVSAYATRSKDCECVSQFIEGETSLVVVD